MAFTLWFTGLPCSGKTTIAEKLEEKLKNKNFVRLDADDDIRNGLNSDLGFSEKDREENLRRVSYVCNLFNKKGINVIACFVSPLDKNRQMINNIIDNFVLVYTDCSLKECEKRDVKGMYKKARQGEIKNFTGIDAPFETPCQPKAEITLDTEKNDTETCVNQVLEKLKNLYKL